MKNGGEPPPEKTVGASFRSDRDCDFSPEHEFRTAIVLKRYLRDQQVLCLLVPGIQADWLIIQQSQKPSDA